MRALTNTSGTVTDARSTDAFGLVVTSSGSTPTPFGFAGSHGYQQDSETGLMRLGHRMYDAATGRFISRDPIQDGYNWYVYCDNDPINMTDPEGLGKLKFWEIVYDVTRGIQVGIVIIGGIAGKPINLKILPKRPTPISRPKDPRQKGKTGPGGGGTGGGIPDVIKDGIDMIVPLPSPRDIKGITEKYIDPIMGEIQEDGIGRGKKFRELLEENG